MYLCYSEFKAKGGTLDEAAFKRLCRRAEYIVNAQAGGMTGERIKNLAGVPEAVKDCVFELISHLSENVFDGSAVQSESQSFDGQSESCTYTRLTKEQADAERGEIVRTYLSGIYSGGARLLYWGAGLC